MAKRDQRRQPKLGVAAPGEGAPLRHSPFFALGTPAGTEPPAADAAAEPPAPAAPAAPAAVPPEPARAERGGTVGRLLLRREKKGRRGKTVVVVSGLRTGTGLSDVEIMDLAAALKQALGCGGTLEASGGDLALVLQGDQPARVAELLRQRGFRVGGVGA